MLASTQPLKILIVDDHPIIREGLRQYVSSAPDMAVVGSAGTGAETLDALKRETPDLVLLDWLLPDARGHDLIPRIKARRNGIKVLVFSAHGKEEIVQDALDAGADGFLSKGEDVDEILRAIRSVAAGQIWAGREQVSRCLREVRERFAEDTRDGRPVLTPREWEVARLVAEGCDNKAVAGKLHISEGTVRIHVSSILGKVSRKSRLQLALWVQENNRGL
jgi:two-component system nitrate/nitrite response regulator NarL